MFSIFFIDRFTIGVLNVQRCKRFQEYKELGDNKIYYILLQTLIIILIQYIFLVFFFNFISEFQVTIAGSYFIVLYFSMQTNYVYMIKEYITTTKVGI